MSDSLGKVPQDVSETKLFAGRFQLDKVIGEGGSSIVYRANDKMLDRLVALKVLKLNFLQDESEKYISRFKEEAKACSLLSHPSIIQILNFGLTQEHIPYISMELLEGKTLEQIFREEPAFDISRFEKIFSKVIEGLAFAHEQGLIHRDLKPGNIMVCNETADFAVVKILDFGIAKQASENEQYESRLTLAMAGSPLYMSPEQCQGKSDQRSDIYSLACIMFESLGKKTPFSGATALGVMYEQIHGETACELVLDSSQQIPGAVVDLITCSLSKDPASRSQSMEEFQQKFLLALKSENMWQRSNNKSWKALAAALALICIVLAAFSAVWMLKEEKISNSNLVVLKKNKKRVERSTDKEMDARFNQLLRENKFGEALDSAMKMLRRTELYADAEPRDLGNRYTQVAAAYLGLKRYDEALEYQRKAIELFPAANSALRLQYVQQLSVILYSKGDLKGAIKAQKESLEYAETALKNGPYILGGYYFFHGNTLKEAGLRKEALNSWRQSLRQYDLGFARTETFAVDAAWQIYDLLSEMGDRANAKTELENTLKMLLGPQINNGVKTFGRFGLQTASGSARIGAELERSALGACIIEFAENLRSRGFLKEALKTYELASLEINSEYKELRQRNSEKINYGVALINACGKKAIEASPHLGLRELDEVSLNQKAKGGEP